MQIDDVKNPVPATNPVKGVTVCLRGTPEGCSCPKCVRCPDFCNDAAAHEMSPQNQFKYLLRRFRELESKVNAQKFQSQINKPLPLNGHDNSPYTPAKCEPIRKEAP